MLPATSLCVVLRLLEEIVFPSVAGEGAAGASCGGFALLFSIMTAASATAFFALRGPPAFFQRSFYLQPLALDLLRAAWLELVK